MEIPNLSQNTNTTEKLTFSLPLVIFLILFGLTVGYLTSRKPSPTNQNSKLVNGEKPISSDSIQKPEDLKVGKIYGNAEKSFKDLATGIIEKGSINGEGTHILNREGGATQRASLTSSAVDLDLFVGRKVEIRGETNSSTKTAWLLDVGSIKILE